MTAGARQGCPLSPYLFIICIELLSNSIENNKDIKGITIEGNEFKQTLFADDGTFITDGIKSSFENLMKSFDNFENISGLRLNAKNATL